MKHEQLTEKIINAAYNVHQTLGKGFLEKVYENALAIELQDIGLKAIQQNPINISYKNYIIGEYFADILIENKVIVELKATKEIIKVHEIQLVNYLAATAIEVGLILNFGEKFEVRRKIFTNRKKLLDKN